MATAEERKVMRSSDLIQMIGVNTHMIYNDGAYAKVDNVIQDLRFLGISYIRDVLPGSDSVPALVGRDALRRIIYDHVKLNILFPSGWDAKSVSWLRSLEAGVPGAIASIEGYNEINNFPVKYEGQTGPAAAKRGQEALYTTIKSDAVLGHVPVVDMTGFEMIRDSSFSYGATLTGFADVMNIHAYSQNGAQPRYWINPARPELYKNIGAELPKVLTEFGYSSRPEIGWGFIGVDERTQAKGILNGIFDAARSGYDRLYIYELLDEKPDADMKELEFHFGLFTFSNDPKLAAKAIRNLTSILADANNPGPEATNGSSPDTSISVGVDVPDPDNPVYSLVLTKRNGARLLAVWREPPFWDRANGRALEEQLIQAKATFGRTCGSIRSYDVLVSGNPVSTSSGDSVSIALGDHVKLVECTL
jgi:hypothetical protein